MSNTRRREKTEGRKRGREGGKKGGREEERKEGGERGRENQLGQRQLLKMHMNKMNEVGNIKGNLISIYISKSI